jgi:hypothetical protein
MRILGCVVGQRGGGPAFELRSMQRNSRQADAQPVQLIADRVASGQTRANIWSAALAGKVACEPAMGTPYQGVAGTGGAVFAVVLAVLSSVPR